MRQLPLPFSGGLLFATIFWIAFASWVLPELLAWKFKHSSDVTGSQDRGSLILIALLWWVGIAMNFACSLLLPQAAVLSARIPLFAIGIAAMFLGVALRWHSAGLLGKYFTFDVTVQSGQRLVELGPYRYVRHPSYTGALLTLLGFGLALGNWAGCAAAMTSLAAAYFYRIPIEETALTAALGDEYKQYMRRTWRLVPFIF